MRDRLYRESERERERETERKRVRERETEKRYINRETWTYVYV